MADKQTMLMPEAELEPRPSDVPIPLDRLATYLRISLFQQLKGSPGVDRAPGALVLRRYQAGEVICRQGEAGWTAFYVLTSDDVAAVTQALADAAADPAARQAHAAESAAWRQRAEQVRRDDEARRAAEAAGQPAEDLPDAGACIHVHLAIPRPRAAGGVGWLGRASRRVLGTPGGPTGRPRFIPIDAPADVDYETRQATIREGEIFGEMSCLNRSPRSATVVAARDCYVLEMLRHIFENIKKDPNYTKRAEEVYRRRVLDQQLRNLPLFADLSNDQLRRVRERARLATYKNGQIICDEHDRSEDAFIIRTGVVKVHKGDSALLRPEDVIDWPGLRAALASAEAVRARLPEPARAVVAGDRELTADDRHNLIHALNLVIKGPALHSDKAFAAPAAAEAVRAELARLPASAKEWAERDLRRLNRRVLEAALPGLAPLRPAGGPETILAYRSRGEMLGEIGLLLNRPRSATCTAYIRPQGGRAPKADQEAVELVHLPADLFDELRQGPAFRAKVQEIAEERRRSDVRTLAAPVAAAGPPVQLSDRFAELGLIQGQRLMLIDLDRCTRCDECVRACVGTHADGRSRLFLDGPRFGPYLVPTTCRSCRDPVCMIGCPVGSIHRGDNGQIVIEDWCIGCEVCAKQCPYGAIQMHDIGVLPEGAHGWRVREADGLSDDDWTRPGFRDSGWRALQAPFRLDRDLLAGRPPAAAYCFRFAFDLSRDRRGATEAFQLEMTAPPGADAALWLDGAPLAPHESKKDKRTYRIAPTALRAGRNVVAARVAPPANYLGTFFDLRIDPVHAPAVGRLSAADYIEKGVTQHAVVCDLCSTLPGKVPACVNACPHDAALRVDAGTAFPAR